MKRYKWYSIVLLGMILLLVSSTVACAKPAPAAFEVVSLNITPADAEVGEAINVTAEIRNTGGSAGVYAATLTIDGAQAETKNVTVAPEATEIVTFSIVKDKAGVYKVAVGEMSSSLEVKEKQPPASSSSPPASETVNKYNDAGLDFLVKGRYESAVAEFNKAIELDQNFAKAYNNRGWAYLHMSKYDLALADFDTAIKLAPNHATYYLSRCRFYNQTSKWDLAIADCSKAIELDPKLASAYDERGYAYYQKGRDDQALADLNKALDLDPNYVASYFTIARIHNRKGQRDLAIADLRKIIEISTDAFLIEMAKQGIEAIEKGTVGW